MLIIQALEPECWVQPQGHHATIGIGRSTTKGDRMPHRAQAPLAPASLTRMERKAQRTEEAYRAIVAKENAARERKTERLRQLRLAREAAEAAERQSTQQPKRGVSGKAGARKAASAKA